jgi:hypothetical protein
VSWGDREHRTSLALIAHDPDGADEMQWDIYEENMKIGSQPDVPICYDICRLSPTDSTS